MRKQEPVADDADQTTSVTRNDDESRYEIRVGGTLAGFVAFRQKPGRLSFTHTLIEPEFEGLGLGSVLVRSALDDVVASGDTIVPYCTFVQSWLKRHPEFEGTVDWKPVQQ
ncbi:N-acetyltransferase [Mycetocola zhujimingii]|nr:N-acetyltransferase [Mycetocola zhujimingii]